MYRFDTDVVTDIPIYFQRYLEKLGGKKKKKSVFGIKSNDTKPNYYSDRYQSEERCSRAALYSTQFHQCSVVVYTRNFSTENLDKEDC